MTLQISRALDYSSSQLAGNTEIESIKARIFEALSGLRAIVLAEKENWAGMPKDMRFWA